MTNATDYTGPPPDDEHRHQLPTYEAAMTRDPLPLVARYVRRQDVFAASLVSRRWRAALLPTLWEEPHRFWGLGRRSELCTCPPRFHHYFCYRYCCCCCCCCCYCTISAIPQLLLRLPLPLLLFPLSLFLLLLLLLLLLRLLLLLLLP